MPLTAETFVVELEAGKYLVYAPLRRAAFIANAGAVNFLADLQAGSNDPADADMAMRDLLCGLEILGAAPELPPIKSFGGQPEPTSLTLFLTTACNLRCTYCYASAGDTPKKFMPLDVAKRGIDFVLANAVKRGESVLKITYHGGGEPTLNWQVMTESHSYARKLAAPRGIAVQAATASNGVLSEAHTDWIIANLDSVSLSFDGLPEVQDRHRLTVLGQGSSERVIRTMRRFDEAAFSYGIRMTVTRDQISALPDSVAFVCAEFNPTRIQVEPAYQMGRWQNAPSAETSEFIQAFRLAQIRARQFGREITFSAARVDTLTTHFCGISQDSFALSPDGNVSACYETFSEDNEWAKTFFYGKPDAGGGYKFNLPVLNHLRGQTVEHRPYCQGCFAKWHCAGDCYHKALTVNGTSEFAGSDRCHITRELTKDQILDKIAAAGGLFWHEPPADNTNAYVPGKEIL